MTRIEEDPLAAAREMAAYIATRNPDAVWRGKKLIEDSWLAPAAARRAC